MEIGEYFMVRHLVWSTIFFPKTKTPHFVEANLIWVGARVIGLGSGLEFVSKAVFRTFF